LSVVIVVCCQVEVSADLSSRGVPLNVHARARMCLCVSDIDRVPH